MTRPEIKLWAKEKIKGEWPNILVASIIAGIITGLAIPYGHQYIPTDYGTYSINNTIPIGFLFYFVQVGFVYYMVKFINGNKPSFNDLFKFKNDFARDLGTGLLMMIFIFLFTLLLIIPGIIKAFAYALVPYLL